MAQTFQKTEFMQSIAQKIGDGVVSWFAFLLREALNMLFDSVNNSAIHILPLMLVNQSDSRICNVVFLVYFCSLNTYHSTANYLLIS